MSNLVEHAKVEFKALGFIPLDQEQEDDPNKWIQENVIELLTVFSEQGHSGTSAPYCVNMFKKLALFEPLGPLTGADWEWHEYADGHFQNIRCSHVFKDSRDGRAYDSEGRIFREPSGSCYMNRDSRVYIEFPYSPTREYVDVPGPSECDLFDEWRDCQFRIMACESRSPVTCETACEGQA